MLATTPLKRQQDFIPELILTHAEELAYLWGRRRAAVFSDSLTLRDLQALQERIDAHLQGLLVAAEALPELLGDWLAADDRDEVFAVACALLRSEKPALAAHVLEAFPKAVGARLQGLGDALGAAPQTFSDSTLRATVIGGSPAHAAVAAAALASQRRLTGDTALVGLLQCEDADTAALAWRTLTIVVATDENPAPLPYRDALRAEAPEVRAAALGAACWRGEAWVPAAIKDLVASGDELGLDWWAATADNVMMSPWREQFSTLPGPQRCALAARSGHPSAIEPLIELMSDPDALTAAAAGTAFTRITGLDIEARRQRLPTSADADDFEREFADEVWLPNASKAQELWRRHGSQWTNGRRWCRGHEISSTLSTAAQASIDLAARWDFGMRAALAGVRLMAPPPVI